MDPTDDQQDVFNKTQCPGLVDKVVNGYNATIFAYGQTSSGKTYTMEGYDYVEDGEGTPVPDIKKGADLGITPRCIKLLFDKIKGLQNNDTKYTVSCSFLQIY